MLSLEEILEKSTASPGHLSRLYQAFERYRKAADVFSQTLNTPELRFEHYHEGCLQVAVQSSAQASKYRFEKHQWSNLLRKTELFAGLVKIDLVVRP